MSLARSFCYISYLKFADAARAEGKEEGWARGLVRGRIEGRVEGRDRGRTEGKEEGKAEGHLETLQDAILKIIQVRFPSLTEAVQQRVRLLIDLEALDELFNRLLTAADEQAALQVFEGLES